MRLSKEERSLILKLRNQKKYKVGKLKHNIYVMDNNYFNYSWLTEDEIDNYLFSLKEKSIKYLKGTECYYQYSEDYDDFSWTFFGEYDESLDDDWAKKNLYDIKSFSKKEKSK